MPLGFLSLDLSSGHTKGSCFLGADNGRFFVLPAQLEAVCKHTSRRPGLARFLLIAPRGGLRERTVWKRPPPSRHLRIGDEIGRFICFGPIHPERMCQQIVFE